MPPDISYTSRLEEEHLARLQDLLFFNENQGRYRDGIIQSIENFGEPFLRAKDGLIRVHTTTLGEVQSIFAMARSEDGGSVPVGVAIFARSSEDTFSLLHISVAREFGSGGPHAKEMVGLKLFQRTMDAARSIRGIRRMTVHYGRLGFSEFPIRR
ncbi:MAG TPA: hypothetical protein VJ997_07635 [Longimicrobiales bacterium]|nr:hypothetical protein [Longimicrobiales bacterium]